MTVAEYKRLETGTKSKYNNTKALWSGNWRGRLQHIVFDSIKERGRWCELLILLRKSQIKELARQERFCLSKPGRIEKIDYACDFSYFCDRRSGWVIEDVKGFKTRVYRLKRKLFLERYPDLLFVEI